MKTKIVEHIAANARFAICEAQGEAVNMCDKYRELKNTIDNGIGLDMAVLREHLEKAEKLISLLT